MGLQVSANRSYVGPFPMILYGYLHWKLKLVLWQKSTRGPFLTEDSCFSFQDEGWTMFHRVLSKRKEKDEKNMPAKCLDIFQKKKKYRLEWFQGEVTQHVRPVWLLHVSPVSTVITCTRANWKNWGYTYTHVRCKSLEWPDTNIWIMELLL